ncbi:DUF6090 family protein [Winogradskyella sp. A3E31]|uniref:DUF6090 family protein n=1 Tax=Winogradskyella sp. A3E31 TaxID=3349637 RepID=UPI00398BBA2F
MEKNKTGKYLKYAIGEIILVVIGILIALQINNWNENRIERNQEQQLLKSLHKELSDNLTELNYDIKRVDSLHHNLNILMDLLLDDNQENTNIDSLMLKTLTTPSWNPSSYVLTDLKNSGKISQLSNINLQEKLFKWERQYDNLLEISEDYKQSNDAYLEFLKSNASLRNIDANSQNLLIQFSAFDFDNQTLLKDIRFENHIDDRFITTSNLKTEYREAKEILEDLLKAINN